MALSRRQGRFQNAIWPGFVDAMTGLLLVLMFVLTIFMVIQFVLRETITGQESQLNVLTAEVSALAQALGLEEAANAELTANLSDATDTASQQAALIERLTQERDAQTASLVQAQNQITGFEAQVAGLLAQRDTANARIATLETTQSDLEATQAELEAAQAQLEAEQTRLLTEAEALNLALATARDEIDAGTEAARLARRVR